ncbi:MFS transporter [Mesorhizobium sp.]|uniref:MFS transporter n=1 Tax=Mesorhizobium sp. TaxID=1871066 RepID=UPI0025DD9958|nr:MFS transporter [Mesorhizobium sp.]
MHERRRAQSRLGARHWTLERDLQDPCHWTETFRTPTWTDYLRLNYRRTTVDKELDDRLRHMAGEQPPRVKLSIERPADIRARPTILCPL